MEINKMGTNNLYKKQIYNAIFWSKGIQKQQLAMQLNFSYPTIIQYTKLLLEDGYIQEYGQYESTGGRKATKFVANPVIKKSVGVEITHNYISFVLTDMYGTLLYHERIYETFAPWEGYAKELAKRIDNFIVESACSKNKILGCGVAFPGVVNSKNNTAIYSETMDLSSSNLVMLEEYLKLPCVFVNDANAAAHAEFRGDSENHLSFYVSLNNTVGGAIFNNGEFMAGVNSRAGDFGHICLIPEGKTCICKRKGCVNEYCSARTLAQETDGKLDVFFDKLNRGDEYILEVWDAYLGHLACLISNLVLGFDYPVVLGGYVGGYMDLYMESLQDKLAKYLILDEDMALVTPCHIQTKAAAVGASLLLVDRYLDNLFTYNN